MAAVLQRQHPLRRSRNRRVNRLWRRGCVVARLRCGAVARRAAPRLRGGSLWHAAAPLSRLHSSFDIWYFALQS